MLNYCRNLTKKFLSPIILQSQLPVTTISTISGYQDSHGFLRGGQYYLSTDILRYFYEEKSKYRTFKTVLNADLAVFANTTNASRGTSVSLF